MPVLAGRTPHMFLAQFRFVNRREYMLRALGPGDAAVLIPGCTKADPFAIMFGDKPMYLEFDPAGEQTRNP